MKVRKISVTGDTADQLVPALQRALSANHPELYVRQWGPVAILALESYFFRVNSTLQTFVVVHQKGEAGCEVEVVSGGGKAGLFSFDWGAESDGCADLVQAIKSACQVIGLGFAERDS